MTELPPHPLGLSKQDRFEKGFFSGVKSTPVIDNYPPREIETLQHSTISYDNTIATMVKSAVDQAMEASDITKKKPEVQENKLTTQDQPCKNCNQAGQKYVHKDTKE